MAAGAPRADFKLILNAVNQTRLPAIIAELMEVLNVDRKTATGAVQAAPVVLIGGLTQPQATNLRTHLLRLTKLGAQLRLTAEPVGKIKQLRWQALPPAVRRPANVFICPTCGERFVVQRWQPAPGAPSAPRPAPPPMPQAAPAPPAPGAAPPPVRPAAPPAAAAVEDDDIPEAEPVEAELVEDESPAAAAPPPKTDVAELNEFLDSVVGEDSNEVAEAELIADEEEAADEAPLPAPEPVKALRPQPAAARPQPAPPAPAPVPKPEKPPAPAQDAATEVTRAAATKARPANAEAQPKAAPAAPAKAPAPGPAPAPAPTAEAEAPDGPRYDVSAAKVRGPSQEKLAAVLAERQGVSFEEAMKLCERTVVVVCRGGTSAEADEWRKALVRIGIKPRIRKR